MTKLEQKLIELGYETNEANDYRFWVKTIKCHIFIYLDETRTQILNKTIDRMLFNKVDYQIAFNEMQKDLEVLSEYEPR